MFNLTVQLQSDIFLLFVHKRVLKQTVLTYFYEFTCSKSLCDNLSYKD
jgi:hypothetical protein